VVLNTIVAESLRQFADELEQAEDFRGTLHELIVRNIHEHKRIIFNGNNYSDEWVKEAGRRGLLSLASTVDALPCYTAEKNIRLFETHKVLSESELRSRRDIGLDSYAKMINIEAETMLMMGRRQILPAVLGYIGSLSSACVSLRNAGASLACGSSLLSDLCQETDRLKARMDDLANILAAKPDTESAAASAVYMHDQVLPAMAAVRASADHLECITDRSCWPFPTYDELLFSIQ
jgi:glutamine synthetase